MSDAVIVSLVLGFIFKGFIVLGVWEDREWNVSDVQIFLGILYVIIPWFTAIIFYIIPFILSPWIKL